MRIYLVDPVSGTQTAWDQVEYTEEGIIIQTEETGLFVVYLFLCEAEAQSAPGSIAR